MPEKPIESIKQEDKDMKGVYYYEEIPMSMVIKAEKLIESKLVKAELKLAVECATQCTAYAELTGNNGITLYVARKTSYDSSLGDYCYHMQLLDKDLNVIESVHYRKAKQGDFGYGISDYVRCADGYCVEPFTHIAVTVIRKTRR